MKPVLLLIMFVATAAAQTGDNAPFSGKWAVHTAIAGNEVDQECTFTQEGSALAGNCTSQRGTVEIRGKVEEQAVSWEYKSEHDGTPLVVAHKGKLGEDQKITGTVSVDAFGVEGEFSASRPK